MNRASKALGALAVLAGFFLAAPAAYAQVPPTPPGCTRITSDATYPGNGFYFYCGTNAPVYRDAVKNTFGNLPTHLRNRLQTNQVYLYTFETAAQYDTVFNQGLAAENRVYGFTGAATYQGVLVKHAAVFEKVVGHPPAVPPATSAVTQVQITLAVVHEQGHALDQVHGLPSINSATFSNTLATDWTAINALTQAQAFPHGIPPNRWDFNSASWVAYTPPPVSDPQRNEKILKALYPWFFQSTPSFAAARGELWASLYQQFRAKHAGFDFTNPYGGTTSWPGFPNGTKRLTHVEVFKLFNMTKNGQNPPTYFQKLWTDPTFVP